MAQIPQINNPITAKNYNYSPRQQDENTEPFDIVKLTGPGASGAGSDASTRSRLEMGNRELIPMQVQVAKDPTLAVETLKDLLNVEVLNQALITGHTELYGELENLAQELYVNPEQLVQEIQNQEQQNTMFSGHEFYDVLREVAKTTTDPGTKEIIGNLLKSINFAQNKNEILGALRANLKFLSEYYAPNEKLSAKLLSLSQEWGADDADKYFNYLKDETLSILKDVSGSLLNDDKTQMLIPLITHNLSRYNNSPYMCKEYFNLLLTQITSGTIRESLKNSFARLYSAIFDKKPMQNPTEPQQPARNTATAQSSRRMGETSARPFGEEQPVDEARPDAARPFPQEAPAGQPQDASRQPATRQSAEGAPDRADYAEGYDREYDAPQVANERPAPAEGEPYQNLPLNEDGTPREDMPQPADGEPRENTPQNIGGEPHETPPQSVDGQPREDAPQAADDTPRENLPQASDGEPRENVPQAADGQPRDNVPQDGANVGQAPEGTRPDAQAPAANQAPRNGADLPDGNVPERAAESGQENYGNYGSDSEESQVPTDNYTTNYNQNQPLSNDSPHKNSTFEASEENIQRNNRISDDDFVEDAQNAYGEYEEEVPEDEPQPLTGWLRYLNESMSERGYTARLKESGFNLGQIMSSYNRGKISGTDALKTIIKGLFLEDEGSEELFVNEQFFGAYDNAPAEYYDPEYNAEVMSGAMIADLSKANTMQELIDDLNSVLRAMPDIPLRERLYGVFVDIIEKMSVKNELPQHGVRPPVSSTLDSLTDFIERNINNPALKSLDSFNAANLLQSLLNAPGVFTPLAHYVLPLDVNGTKAFGELWVDNDENNPNNTPTTQRNYHLFLTFDVESIGRFEVDMYALGDEVNLSLLYPPRFEKEIEPMKERVTKIIRNSGYSARTFETAPLKKPHNLVEVFPKITNNRTTLNTRV